MVNAKMACLLSMAMLLAGSSGIGCKTRNELNARWVDSPDPKNISFYIDHSDTKFIEVYNGTGKEVEYTVLNYADREDVMLHKRATSFSNYKELSG